MIVRVKFLGAAVAVLLSAPTIAQIADKAEPSSQSAIAAARAGLMQCAIATGTTLGRTSQEGAEILAEVVVYRCMQATSDQRRFGDRSEARLAAADAIVKARSAK